MRTFQQYIEAKKFKPKDRVWFTDQEGELKEVTIMSYNPKAKLYVIDMNANEMEAEPEELEKM